MTPRDPAALRLWLLQHSRAADYERASGVSSGLLHRLSNHGLRLPVRGADQWLAIIERIETMRRAARDARGRAR